MINLKNISKTFKAKNADFKALDDISFTVEEGEILGIVGTSGAGKSTVLRCINLLERPDDGGVVVVDGAPLLSLSKKDLQKERENIAMIFQHFNLFSQRNVRKNISFSLEKSQKKSWSKEEINDRVDELLQLVGLEDKGQSYPAELSGGQKQRVAIARALAAHPKVLLCDEATSALDPETTSSILNLLKEINQKLGITIVLITHEKAVVKKICGRIIILEKGKIIEENKTINIFTNPQTPAGEAFAGGLLEENEASTIIKSYMHSAEYKGETFEYIFLGNETMVPFVSDLSKKYDVLANILFGNIEVIAGEIVGRLIVNLVGEDIKIKEATAYLRENKIRVKEIEK